MQYVLDSHAAGWQVTGGGTLLSEAGEPLSCDIDVEAEQAPPGGVITVLTRFLNAAGVPRGSCAALDERDRVGFGVTDGLGLYLDGRGLPAQVYEASDVNELISLLGDALTGHGKLESWWEGPAETALYLYGASAPEMRELISGVLATYPLCRGSRLVAIT